MEVELLKKGTKGNAVPLENGDTIPERFINVTGNMNGFSRITVSDVAPANPQINDLWIDTNL